MHRSGRFAASLIFLGIHYQAAHAMVSSVSSTCQETEHSVEYTLPPAHTLQESAQRKIVAMLSSGDFEEGLKLAQEVQTMRCYERRIKAAFINEHLLAYYNNLFDQKLTSTHVSYYTNEERSGLPRSGTFVLGEAGFVILVWKIIVVAEREFHVATLDLWMLEDLLVSNREKKPHHSKLISLGEGEATAWIPAMRIKRYNAKPIDKELIDNSSYDESSRAAYQRAVEGSNRFLLWTPKLVQIWTVNGNQELVHETTLEFAAIDNDISLSPDGSKITIKPCNADEIVISLDMLCTGNEETIAKVTEETIAEVTQKRKTLTKGTIKKSCIAFPHSEIAQWSHCGEYLASTSSTGRITLWNIVNGLPEALTYLEYPEAFRQRISFALSSRRQFITYLTSIHNHPPLVLHLFDTRQKKGTPLYQDSSPQSTRLYQYHVMQMSDDERYCLISVSQSNPVLVDLLNQTSLTLDPKPKESSPEAHMTNITLNSAALSCTNSYVLSINSNIAQIISLHSPFSSLTLVQLFLLQRILGTETPDTKKKALRLFASTIEDIKGEKAQLTKILRALEKQEMGTSVN